MDVRRLAVDVTRIARPIDTDHHIGSSRVGVIIAEWIVEKMVVVEIGETGAVDNGAANFTSICPHHLHNIMEKQTIAIVQ